MSQPPGVDEVRFRGEPAIELRAGRTSATFLPGLGMTGVSIRHRISSTSRGLEYLAVPGGIVALRAGTTLGLPLLAPWANRLASRSYRVGGTRVDLTTRETGKTRLPTDANGLPIHGFLVGASGWRVGRTTSRVDSARVAATIDVDAPAFPFPHRIELAISLRDGALKVDTTIVPTGRRRVPVSFGWHPYLQLPGTPRREWELRLPTRRHLALDAFGIPTGESVREPAEAAPIGRRTFDDAYFFGLRPRARPRLALVSERSSVELRCGTNYPFGQVWVPPGKTFAALEPMTAPTNALIQGTTPLVLPGDELRASFVLALT
jgi:aldose 1-epimerase